MPALQKQLLADMIKFRKQKHIFKKLQYTWSGGNLLNIHYKFDRLKHLIIQ